MTSRAGPIGTRRVLALAGLDRREFEAGEITFDSRLIRLPMRVRQTELQLEIGARGEGEKAAFRSEHLFVRYTRTTDDKWAWKLAGVVNAQLRGRRFEELFEALQEDAQPEETGSEAMTPEEDQTAQDESAEAPSDHRDSHHEAAWWRFCYPFERVGYRPLAHDARWAWVYHASLECSTGPGGLLLPVARYFPNAREPEPPRHSGIGTLLDETDVMAGRTQARLDETVQETLDSGQFDIVEIQSTCLPAMLGDHPSAIPAVRSASSDTRVFWQCKTDEEDRLLLRRFVRDRLSRLGSDGPRDPSKVVLAGADEQIRRDLTEPLACLGLSVERTLLPDIRLLDPGTPSDAATLAWADPRGWDWIDWSPLGDDFHVVEGEPPFGVEGTTSWLRRVAEAAGVTDAEERVASAAEVIRPALEGLRSQCAAHRVALIGGAPEIRAHFDGRGRPFAVGPLLLEMGFRVRVLRWDGTDELEDDALDDAADLVRFATKEELDAQLREVSLAMSSFNHDPRLAAHALHRFDESFFSVGYAGFVRSARRLAALCRRRPFPDHRRFLSSWLD